MSTKKKRSKKTSKKKSKKISKKRSKKVVKKARKSVLSGAMKDLETEIRGLSKKKSELKRSLNVTSSSIDMDRKTLEINLYKG